MITTEQVVVTAGIVIIVGLVAFTIGLWTGHGRDLEYMQQLENELEERQALDAIAAAAPFLERAGMIPPEVAHEPWPAHVDQALAVAKVGGGLNPSDQPLDSPFSHFETVLMPSVVIPPDPDASVTGWTKAMAADMDRFITGLIGQTDETLREITR